MAMSAEHRSKFATLEKIFKERMNFRYISITYMATPQDKNPCSEGYGIYNIGRPFLAYQYYGYIVIYNLSKPCPR